MCNTAQANMLEHTQVEWMFVLILLKALQKLTDGHIFSEGNNILGVAEEPKVHSEWHRSTWGARRES